MRGRTIQRCAAAVAALLVGCGGNPPVPTPTSAELGVIVAASDAVNPDIAGRPSPVVVKLYQLRSAGGFEAGDFFSLYGTAAAVLGPDLVAAQDLVVRPGERRTLDDTLDPHARFVGIVAGFRDVQNARWRAVVAVPAKGPERRVLEIRLTDLTAEASFVAPAEDPRSSTD